MPPNNENLFEYVLKKIYSYIIPMLIDEQNVCAGSRMCVAEDERPKKAVQHKSGQYAFFTVNDSKKVNR